MFISEKKNICIILLNYSISKYLDLYSTVIHNIKKLKIRNVLTVSLTNILSSKKNM